MVLAGHLNEPPAELRLLPVVLRLFPKLLLEGRHGAASVGESVERLLAGAADAAPAGEDVDAARDPSVGGEELNNIILVVVLRDVRLVEHALVVDPLGGVGVNMVGVLEPAVDVDDAPALHDSRCRAGPAGLSGGTIVWRGC